MECGISVAAPLGERERLAAVERARAIESGSDAVFDRIVSLARRILGVESAAVNLMEFNSQWTWTGSHIPRGTTMPRDESFCAWAIEERRTVIVCDARRDPRFESNPLVIGPPFLAFYAGSPLFVEEHAIGTLCVYDPVPRRFGPAEIETLEGLAKLVRDNIVLRSSAGLSPAA